MLLQKEVKRYEEANHHLSLRIQSAIKVNRDDIAENYALQLQRSREALATSREQLKSARMAYDKALQVKKTFMKEKDRKIREARDAMRESERSKWQGRVADTLEQCEVAGTDATHDEMISRIKEETARNEARMELALDSLDSKSLELEFDAEKMKAGEIVNQFKSKIKGDRSLRENDSKKSIMIHPDANDLRTRQTVHSGNSRTG